jgi:hypothetical protein
MKRDTNIYRKIYKQYHGDIPKDEDGISYEIHHIDGNSDNNNIENLICLTIHEHYEIHYWQEDWNACYLISQHMIISSEERSELSRKGNLKRVENGTHHFIGGEIQRKMNHDRVLNGTHPFVGGAVVKKTNRERLENGTHNFLDRNLNKDLIVYTWKNLKTEEEVKMTRYDFVRRYDLLNYQGNISQMIKGRFKTVKDWCIIDTTL